MMTAQCESEPAPVAGGRIAGYSIPATLKAELKAEAGRRGVPMSTLVVQALRLLRERIEGHPSA